MLPQYDQWNESIAKKYATMFKNYIKFKQRFLQASSGAAQPEQGDGEAFTGLSKNLGKHLLRTVELGSQESEVFTKFENENSPNLKTDQLQQARHFEIDLEGSDPFFVEGQEDVIAM